MRWRLYPEYFSRAGRFRLRLGELSIELDVHADGTFVFDGEQTIPLYAFAAPVGSRREQASLAIARGNALNR